MKKIGLVLALNGMAISALSFAALPDGKTAVISDSSSAVQKASYGLGYRAGKVNSEMQGNMDQDAFLQGYKDAYRGKATGLTEAQIVEVLAKYKRAQAVQESEQEMQAFQAESEKNVQASAAFLADNGKKAGVVSTSSGLQYLVLKQGNGKQPLSTSRVKVHYEGRLIDGTVFDSSIARGEPVVFPLNQVITGWTQGLQLMKEGAKYRFFIPAGLAYGETGSNAIPPNSALVFDVELLEVLPAQADDKTVASKK
jgi:FKBP-type peptidyl-prolyl cis-trans isomerase FklB